MTKEDQKKTKEVIAQSVGASLDSIRMTYDKSKSTTYLIESFKGYNIGVDFVKIPTVKEARERIKELYLGGVEWDFDEEMEAI